ncbi:MAG TPA: hypothetical protein VLB07_10020, partial [Woeseiaceae bacterium]|nr:hypothetical protein [Woeseiaceae bacterium]
MYIKQVITITQCKLASKGLVLLLCGALLPAVATAAENAAVPAFPGAVGWAASTPGGRGGRIVRVTNLDGDGAGSLRAA